MIPAMKFTYPIFTLLIMLGTFISCERDEDIDKEKPTVDISYTGAFPTQCDTLYFGQDFYLRIQLRDNVELGSFSIDIHHNFDGHSHSSEVLECTKDPVKDPVNPFILIEDFDIPVGLKVYETDLALPVALDNNAGPFDEGDYHFFISLTDKEGWSAQRGLSIKMLYR